MTVVVLCALYLFASCGNAQKQKPADVKLRFAYLTDVHLNQHNRGNGDEGLQKALTTAADLGAEFVLFGGDNVETDRMKDEAQADSLHARFKRIVAESGIPSYFTMGNHDRFYEYNGQRDTLGFRMFEKHYGATCYSFTRQGVHFVVLNALHPAQGKPYWVDDEQLAWLQADLEQAGKGMPVILSTHVPLLSLYYPVVDGTMKAWDMVHNSKAVVDLLKRYDTRLVLQGHQHLYEQIYERDLWFVTAGAVSADWWKGPLLTTEEGFLMVEVDEHNGVSWRYVNYGWTAVGKQMK